jgi:hypothetical protein
MFKKPLIIATLAATAALATLSTRADAADPVLGALIGGGIGAAIGNSVHHHNGAAVGGVLGAITGAAIANDVNRSYYYGDGGYYAPSAPAYSYGPDYYAAPAPSYYAPPPPVYYGPAYYPAATVVIGTGRYYGHGYRHHHRRWH